MARGIQYYSLIGSFMTTFVGCNGATYMVNMYASFEMIWEFAKKFLPLYHIQKIRAVPEGSTLLAEKIGLTNIAALYRAARGVPAPVTEEGDVSEAIDEAKRLYDAMMAGREEF